MASWGPLGLFFLAIIDSAGIPIPAGVDLLLIGIAMHQPSQAYVAAVCAVLGSLIGNCILFGIARKGGEAFLEKHISRGTGRRLHAWFQRYGLVTVFIPAVSFVPLPMKVPVFCSGALGVRWSRFVAVVVTARAIRYFVLAFLGERYGTYTLLFLRKHIIVVLLVTLVLAGAVFVGLRLADKRTRKQAGI